MSIVSPATRREVILLGTGTSNGVPLIGCKCPICQSDNPRNKRTRTGVVIRAPEGNILIDTPPELRLQLVREGVDQIHAAMYTHAHADHLFGLDDLRVCQFRLGHALPLYCEPFVAERIRKAFDYAFSETLSGNHELAAPRLVTVPVDEAAFDLLGVRVQPLRLFHGQLPILGYRVGNFAFCTDVNRIPDETLPLLQDLDVLVIDALHEQSHPTHFSIWESVEIAKQLNPRQTYLTHLSHRVDYDGMSARLPPGVALAYDGLRFDYA